MTEQEQLPQREKGLWRLAFRWLLVLGPLFFVSYNAANQFTATRGDVGTAAFDWERHIPFLPWMIIPYWSIDAIYAGSLFLCRTRRELHVHGLRLAVVSLVCVVCFLLFPLKFSFPRPETSGALGWLFTQLEFFDLPYNQAPSLHIALLVTLWSLFRVNTPKPFRWFVHVWALLIAVSVLTTWQHHIVDVYTGLVAGTLVCYALPLPPRRWQRWKNASNPAARRLAWKYGCGALLFGAAAVAGAVYVNTWLIWLLWPALSLGMVCAAYLWLGASVFQKSPEGKLTPAAFFVLLPYLFGAWLSFRYYTARVRPYNWVSAQLVLGQYPVKGFIRELLGREKPENTAPPIAAVLDMAAGWQRSRLVHGLEYTSCPRMDLVPPDAEELEHSVQALHALMDKGPVLVHCALGFSRSAIVAVAWLYGSGNAATLHEAVDKVRISRPSVVLKDGHLQALETWAAAFPRKV